MPQLYFSQHLENGPFTRTNYTENFVTRFIALPVNVKVGYSWGQSPR